jgi:hypothetical protein
MGSDYTDIDLLMCLLFDLGVIDEEIANSLLDNSNFWWPPRV